MTNQEKIAAVCWAARKQGLTYGQMSAHLQRWEAEQIYEEYQEHRREVDRAKRPVKRPAGEAVQGGKPKAMTIKKQLYQPRTFRDKEAKALYDQGMNDREIADALQIGKNNVLNWRHGRGLPPNVNRGRPEKAAPG